MIENYDLLSMHYYDYKQPFTGSYRGMRYKLEKAVEKREDGPDEVSFLAQIWPEPYSYEATDPAKITGKSFPFSEEGKLAVVAWLNEMHESGSWKSGFTLSQLKKLEEEQ